MIEPEGFPLTQRQSRLQSGCFTLDCVSIVVINDGEVEAGREFHLHPFFADRVDMMQPLANTAALVS